MLCESPWLLTQLFFVASIARERVTAHGYLNGDGFGLGWYPVGVAV